MNLLAQPHMLVAAGGPGGVGIGGWFWPVIPLFWIAVLGLTVWFVARRRPTEPDEPGGLNRARDVLAERYARGEVSTDEYRERLGNLR